MKIFQISVALILLFSQTMYSQELNFKSIHQEESEFYKNQESSKAFKSSSTYFGKLNNWENKNKDYTLEKRVFGYHPYWGGDNYLNYQWDLLSDLCFFSYEVEPGTGNPSTTHGWDTSDAIDSALVNNVNVHLCVTLFSGHSTFFNSSTAQQTLIDNIINLVDSRNAHGVNMDVEALPSAYGDEYTDFLISLCEQMHTALPGSEVSIAAPAVNWSGTIEIEILKDHIDFFMVMGYDYYWNGSSQAGPVSPLYSMVGNYDYNFSKTISYYQSEGAPNDKLVMGVPYYAREWETEGQFAPSNATGTGATYTYSYIQNNTSGNYSIENKHSEPNSFAPYFSFQSGGWKQCFLDDEYSLGKKYDIVARRNIAGIGIWALGYDDGYSDLWDLIAQKFTEGSDIVLSDTIFDTGGPAFNYYNYETYTYTISAPENKAIELTFNYLELEPVYDSLWIFDGPDISYYQLGTYSGNINPGTINSTGNYLTLKFFSDIGITNPGWEAFYNTVPVSGIPENDKFEFSIYPNPFKDELNISFTIDNSTKVGFEIYNILGQLIYKDKGTRFSSGFNIYSIDKKTLCSLYPSTYIIYLKIDDEIVDGSIFLKQ